MSAILITGSSGNLGTAVVKRLVQEAQQLITLDRSLPQGFDLDNKLIQSYQMDLLEES